MQADIESIPIDISSDAIEKITYDSISDCFADHNIQKPFFSFIHINIQRLTVNWDNFLLSFHTYLKFLDVIVFSEVSIKDEMLLDKFILDHFIKVSWLRRNRGGGGICLFIKDTINFTHVPCATTSFESVLIEISLNTPFKFLAVYRPPNLSKTSFITELNDLIDSFSNNGLFVITGDCNIDLLDGSSVTQNYIDSLNTRYFLQGVNNFTRVAYLADHWTKSCIDHVFTRIQASFAKIRTFVIKIPIADHFIVGASFYDPNGPSILSVVREEPLRTKTILDKAKFDKLMSDNATALLVSSDCPLTCYNHLDEFYNRIKNECTRVVSIKCARYLPKKEWMTAHLVQLINKRDRMSKRLGMSDFELLEYRRFRNRLNKDIKLAKRRYYGGLFEEKKDSIKGTWEIINKHMGRLSKNSPDNEINKHFLKNNVSPSEICNGFCSEFSQGVSSIIHSCDVTCLPESVLGDEPALPNRLFDTPTVTNELVRSVIMKLNEKKSPGIDKICVDDIKRNINVLIEPIATIIRNSFESGLIPDKLKTAVVRPIYKSGKKNDFKNYRPISILPVLDKVMERIVDNEFRTYLYTHMVIPENQFGFQRKKSTTDLLIRFTNYVNSMLNKNFHVLAIFVDFKKAFDTLSHHTLLIELEKIGCSDKMLQWLKSYLQNRFMAVQTLGYLSDMKTIESGVPQGSILGPLLYLIYVRSMKSIFKKCTIFQFADDTVVLTAHPDLGEALKTLESEFYTFQQWVHDFRLVINEKKTNVIHFRPPKVTTTPLTVKFHSLSCLHLNQKKTFTEISCACSDILPQVCDQKYLGIMIDDQLKWCKHVDVVFRRLRSCLYGLFSLAPSLDTKTLLQVYKALAESIIRYGLPVWGTAADSYTDKIYNMQTALLKIIAKGRNFPTQKDLFKNFNCLPIKTLFQHSFTVANYYCSRHLLVRRESHDRSRRQNRDLARYEVPRYNNMYGYHALATSVPRIFNGLPMELLTIQKIGLVKKSLYEWLLNNM